MSAILTAQRLSKAFGGLQAVYGLSFQVERGEILGLIGPNGAGKTTVFNLIMGTHKPDGGRIAFKGRDITGWSPYRVVNAGIARAFQIAQCCESKTVYENLELCVFSNHLFSWGVCRLEPVLQAAKRVGLVSELEKTPGMLPQAGLKRLEIARAIATSPELLLLDEPFAGLTPAEIGELSRTIEELRAQGMTIVLVDHNMRGVMRLVDRVLVMSFGQLIAEGTPEEVLSDPKVHEVYLGSGEF
jgi:branched-chain amino acid transport system ATP-binding protein